MLRRLGPWAAIVGALAASAASGCSTPSNVASCTISGTGDAGVTQTVCEELGELTPESQHVFSGSCFVSSAQYGEGSTATFAAAPCPRAGALGGCRLNASPSITFWYYAGGQYTADDVPAVCAQIDATPVAP
jgi:hypothetical protein